MTLPSSPAWKALVHHRDTHARRINPQDVARLDTFNIAFDGLRLNYAFQNVVAETLPLLLDLAKQQNLVAWRERMFAGEKINGTEKRAVLHTALRRKEDAPLHVDNADVMPQIRATQKRIAAFVDHPASDDDLTVGGRYLC